MNVNTVISVTATHEHYHVRCNVCYAMYTLDRLRVRAGQQ
jgi:hypothetical protein